MSSDTILDRVEFGLSDEPEELGRFVGHPMWQLPVTCELFVDYGGEPFVYLSEEADGTTWLVFDAGRPNDDIHPFPAVERQHFYYLRFSSATSAMETVLENGLPSEKSFDSCEQRVRFVYSWETLGPWRTSDHRVAIEIISSDMQPCLDRVHSYLLALAPDEPG